MSVDDIDFLIVAEDDFIGTVVVKVGQGQTAHGFIGGVGTETDGESRHGRQTVAGSWGKLDVYGLGLDDAFFVDESPCGGLLCDNADCREK